MDDRAYIGGASAVHQFCRIGRLAMIGGLSRVTQDVPPFVMVEGGISQIVGLNKVGDANWNTGGGTVVDARSHFLIEGLAAGAYELTVSAYVPEWRQRPRTSKQLVTVTDGAATDVILTIDLTPPRSVNVPLMNTERQ